MEIALMIILVVLVVALFVISYMKKKKYSTELGQMREELKVGDKVMTDTGVVGEVVDSYVEDEYKYFVLKSGKDNNVGYFTVHANAIYYVFGKEQAQKQEKVVVKVAPKTAETKPAEEVKKEDKKQ
ncbi:MAG: preprotein translocase subunit YajC [Clostridia bacterium]|nr:preprotein translocase subunit YajC [Clostridia bacterium]